MERTERTDYKMTKKVAVITGASSGIGKRFAETVERAGSFDEVWVIARRPDRLAALKDKIPFPVRPLALDLTDRESYDVYASLLREEQPEIGLLINCSGFGKFCATLDVPLSENLNMMDLNCGAVMAMCQLSLPYMNCGGNIINIASVAAYQPIPYINVYAATKSFVLSYSRALAREVKGRGVCVCAVCPFWTKTEFFNRSVVKDTDGGTVVKKYIAMYEPEQIVDRAWHDALRGRDMSRYGFKAIMQGFLTKLLPHSLVMNVWQSQQKLK